MWNKIFNCELGNRAFVTVLLGSFYDVSFCGPCKKWGDMNGSKHSYIFAFFSSLKIYLFFNWRIIALQNFVVFCQTSAWISHWYTDIPSLLNLAFNIQHGCQHTPCHFAIDLFLVSPYWCRSVHNPVCGWESNFIVIWIGTVWKP